MIEKFLENAKVGDTIKIKFKDGNEYELVKYHDGVIGTRDCPFGHEMNEDWMKKADWNTSDMKSFIEKWFNKNAPKELKELCSVTIPSATNVFGDKYKDWHNDDKSEIQWDFFKDWRNRIKTRLDKERNEEGYFWWLRSPYAGDSYYFVFVYTSGSAGNYYRANYTHGVALCFLKK